MFLTLSNFTVSSLKCLAESLASGARHGHAGLDRYTTSQDFLAGSTPDGGGASPKVSQLVS